MNMKRLWMLWAVVSVCVLAASVSHAATGACGAWVSDDGTVHIPEVNVDGAIYWATLQLQPSQNGLIMLTATDYGLVAEGHCDNSQRTFYLESEGYWRAFIPMVEYAGGAYWAMLELVPSHSGLLWFKVTGYGNGGDWSGEGGALLATMKIEVVSASDLQMTVKGRSPLGLEAELTTTLLPNQPASPPSFTHSEPTQGTTVFRLTYTVPYSDLPPDVVGRLRGAQPLLNATSDPDGDGTVAVVVEGGWRETVQNVAEHIAEQTFGEIAKGVVEASGGILDVFEALDIREKHEELMKQLDALEGCVKKVYSNDPASLQSKLNYLEGFRFEAKVQTGMRFMTMMNEVIYGATPLAVPTAALGAAGSTRLDELDKSLLEQAALFTVGGTTKDGKFFPNSCPVYWSGTFEGSILYAPNDCLDQEIKVTAEVQFDYNSSNDPTFFQYPLRTGSLHVTAGDPWYTCIYGDHTVFHYLSPNSFTVTLPPNALVLNVVPLHDEEWLAISYSVAPTPDILVPLVPAMEKREHTVSEEDDHWWTFDFEIGLEALLHGILIALGESVDSHVISYHQFLMPFEQRWYLKEE